MSRAALALALVLLACTLPPARTPDDGGAFAARLAKQLDRDASPLWPTIPAELRAGLEVTVAPDPGSRLAAARDRLGAWTLDLDGTPDELTAQFRTALEGLFLAEPLAFTSSPDALAAAGLLYRLYAALDQPRYGDWLRTASQIPVDRKLHELLAAAAPTMRAHLAAKLLRANQPSDAVATVLRDLGARAREAGAPALSRSLFVELTRRLGDAAPIEDWFSTIDAHLRADDRAAAASSLARARAAASPDRRTTAGLRDYARDLALLDRYLALRARTDLDGRLARIDLLRRLGRTSEARAQVAELRAAHPKDARLRVRSAALAFELMGPSDPLTAAAHVARELADDGLDHKDGDYWAMQIGAEGMHLMGEILPSLSRDPVAGAHKLRQILATLRTRTAELAAASPGRAAALAFVLDRAIPLLDRTADGAAVIAVLSAGLPDALALRARHPDTIDADRLVFTLATFSPDRAAGLAALAQRPRTPPDDDPELYLLRARTALPLAAVTRTPAAIATARTLVDEIAPSWDAKVEAARESLLGDCDALDFLLSRAPAALAAAATHYQAARSLHKDGRARLTNNLGWIAAQRGQSRLAEHLFLQAASDDSDRRWVPFLNALTSPARTSDRLESLRTLITSERTQGTPPIALLVWLAALSPDAHEASAAAREALASLAEPFTAAKPDTSSLGIETEGVFQVGLGIASLRLYELNTQAYASLWLMPPLPLDATQLQAKAQPPSPAKPAAPAKPSK